jgi:hypothetical protein
MTSFDADSGNNYSISLRSISQSSVVSEPPSLDSERAVSESPTAVTDNADAPIPSDTSAVLKDIRPLFNRVHKAWSRNEPVDEEHMVTLTKYHVTVDDFVKLTQSRALQKYIALIDNRIRFDEIPLSPHGQIIFYVTDLLSEQFQTTQPGNVLYGTSDNGMSSSIPS